MKTEAVMCIALTRQSPSRTRLSFTAFSTSPVIFTKSIRSGTFTVRYFVCDSMRVVLRELDLLFGASDCRTARSLMAVQSLLDRQARPRAARPRAAAYAV